MGLFNNDRLKGKKRKIIEKTDWRSGSILGGDFDKEIRKIDRIDAKARRKENRKRGKGSKGKSYGVRREHGWYLPNDD